MPTERTWTDLLKTSSPLVAITAAGCAASNLLQMQGGEMILGGGLAWLGFGGIAAGTNVLSGVIANRFHDQTKLKSFDPQSLLENQHLHKLTARAIKLKLLEAAGDEALFLPSNVARLKTMAENIEAVWDELHETLAFNLVQMQLTKEDLQRWFLEARDLNNSATLLQDTNLLADAESLLRRAVEIFRASLGEEHPNTVTVVENYRLLREAMG